MKLLAIVLTMLLAACGGGQQIRKIDTRSYTLGAEKVAFVGSPMLTKESGTLWAYQGTMVSVPETAGDDYLIEELIYSGTEGATLRLAYREYRQQGRAAPAFFQDLTYNLAESKTIRFRNYKIEIVKAGNDAVTYVVVSDSSQ